MQNQSLLAVIQENKISMSLHPFLPQVLLEEEFGIALMPLMLPGLQKVLFKPMESRDWLHLLPHRELITLKLALQRSG